MVYYIVEPVSLFIITIFYDLYKKYICLILIFGGEFGFPGALISGEAFQPIYIAH